MRITVLLLPVRLEEFERRAEVEELMQVEGVVVCDPPTLSYARLARLPDGFGAGVADKQARRLRKRLPGEPAAMAIFDAAQYPLARGVIARSEDCVLWYLEQDAPGDERLDDLHALALERASVVFKDNADLWDPLYTLLKESPPSTG